jgi:hypothetical protein
MRRLVGCLCLVLILSCLVAPTALYAGGPVIPSPPVGGQDVQGFVAALMQAIQNFLAGGGEPLP